MKPEGIPTTRKGSGRCKHLRRYASPHSSFNVSLILYTTASSPSHFKHYRKHRDPLWRTSAALQQENYMCVYIKLVHACMFFFNTFLLLRDAGFFKHTGRNIFLGRPAHHSPVHVLAWAIMVQQLSSAQSICSSSSSHNKNPDASRL